MIYSKTFVLKVFLSIEIEFSVLNISINIEKNIISSTSEENVDYHIKEMKNKKEIIQLLTLFLKVLQVS